jgi:hypothetical protein
MSRNRILVASVVIAAGAIVIFLGYSATLGSASGRDAITYGRSINHPTPIPNGTPAQILSAAVQRAASPRVAKAELADPPPVPGARPGNYLHFVVKAPATDERSMRAEWEADLIEGAVADAYAAHGHAPVVGSVVDVELPSGQVAENAAGGMGDVNAGQDFSSSSDAWIESDLKQKLDAVKLTPLSVFIEHVDQPAPAVVLRTDSPSSAVADAANTLRTLFGHSPATYEGYYFELQDSSSKPILIMSTAYRTGAGRDWVTPAYANVSPISHG